MGTFWIAMGNLIPSTWGATGYIAMQSNGASLAAQSQSYLMLWLLCGLYFVTASLVEKFIARRQNTKG